MSTPVCSCKRFATGVLLGRWNTRSFPAIQRAMRHGHKIPMAKLGWVVHLIEGINKGSAESFLPSASPHHLKDCPLHPSNRATVPRIDIVSSRPASSPGLMPTPR